MYLMYQAFGRKVEKMEIARQAAIREVYEETGIALKPRRLKFVANDSEFDCNVYVHKISNIIPERREPAKMTEWLLYPWTSVEILKERKKLTPSLIKFHKEILVAVTAKI